MPKALMTRISLPGVKAFRGLLVPGRNAPEAMIEDARSHAARLRAEAEAIEAAANRDFQVDVVRGAIVSDHVAELQRSARRREEGDTR